MVKVRKVRWGLPLGKAEVRIMELSMIMERDPRTHKCICTEEHVRFLRENYATTRTKDIQKMFGVSSRVMNRLARELGLKKDRDAHYAMSAAGLRNTWNGEKRRVRIGLNQRTGLTCPVDKYSETHHGIRYRAQSRGYVLGDAYEFSGERYTIFFTEESRRSAIFERHCVQHGIAVKDFESRKR